MSNQNKKPTPHTIYFGINGVGLGHIARLSVVQRYMAEHHPDNRAEALCRSTMGSTFFTCTCTNVPKGRDLANALGIRGPMGFINVLRARFFPANRKTVVFDTWWSRSVVKKLKFGKHRTVAIVESFKPEDMLQILDKADGCIDHIFFPCQPEEIEFHYKDHPKLWALLQQKKYMAVGPFVRPAEASDTAENIIFTLGGGGENIDEDPRYSIRGYMEQYVEAARMLQKAGKTNLYLAKGPLMEIDIDLGPLEVLETMQLPNHFGPNSTVIARGTYNLCWEAIAAGSKLITTTRSAVLPEFSDSRNAYLDQCGYAYQSDMTGGALAEAILRDKPAHLIEAMELVNARPGLARIAQVLCGENND